MPPAPAIATPGGSGSAVFAAALGNLSNGAVNNLLTSGIAPSAQLLAQTSGGQGAGGYLLPPPLPASATTTGGLAYVIWLDPAPGFPSFAQEVSKFECREKLRDTCLLDGVSDYILWGVQRWSLGAASSISHFATVSRSELDDLAYG